MYSRSARSVFKSSSAPRILFPALPSGPNIRRWIVCSIGQTVSFHISSLAAWIGIAVSYWSTLPRGRSAARGTTSGSIAPGGINSVSSGEGSSVLSKRACNSASLRFLLAGSSNIARLSNAFLATTGSTSRIVLYSFASGPPYFLAIARICLSAPLLGEPSFLAVATPNRIAIARTVAALCSVVRVTSRRIGRGGAAGATLTLSPLIISHAWVGVICPTSALLYPRSASCCLMALVIITGTLAVLDAACVSGVLGASPPAPVSFLTPSTFVFIRSTIIFR